MLVAAVCGGVGAEGRVAAVDVAVRADVQRDREPAGRKLPAHAGAVERNAHPDERFRAGNPASEHARRQLLEAIEPQALLQ